MKQIKTIESPTPKKWRIKKGLEELKGLLAFYGNCQNLKKKPKI